MFREGSKRDYDLLLNFFGELNANVKYRCEDYKAKKVKETVKKSKTETVRLEYHETFQISLPTVYSSKQEF